MPVPQDYYMLDLIKRLGGSAAPAEPTQAASPARTGKSLLEAIFGSQMSPNPAVSNDLAVRGMMAESPSMDPPVGGVSDAAPEPKTMSAQEIAAIARKMSSRSSFSNPRAPTLEGLDEIDRAVTNSQTITPPQEPESGALRFSVGGKWYERAPGTSGGTFETTPRQTDKGMAFDRGAPASAGDMSAVRQQVRSQGAFGSTTPLGPDRGPGGFSPSPRVEDVAVMPESVLEEQDKQRIARELSRANADMSPVSDEELPPELSHLKGLGLSRGEMRSILAGMLTANRGSDKANALPILNAIDAQWRAEVKKVREDQSLTPEQKAENEAILTQNMLDARKAHGFEAPQGML
jgi:hypothetical protein